MITCRQYTYPMHTRNYSNFEVAYSIPLQCFIYHFNSLIYFLFSFRDAKPQVYDHLDSLSLTPDKLKDILYDKDIKRTR